MDAQQYIVMLQDKHFFDLKKMEYKYSKTAVGEMLNLLELQAVKELPLSDFTRQEKLRYLAPYASSSSGAASALMRYRGSASYGVQALTDEIISTLSIEQIHTSRKSIRTVLAGKAPVNAVENHIWGMKKGFEFIADKRNSINEETVRALYELVVNPYLEDQEDRLSADQLYREGAVSIVNETKGKIIHSGAPAGHIQAMMQELFDFLNQYTAIDDLAKATVLHFFVAYVHPYYDGNGRMARMLHLWYLLQNGYSAALFLPFSSIIQENKAGYYKAFDLISANYEITGRYDISPFLDYFNQTVYAQIKAAPLCSDSLAEFQIRLKNGEITAKEKELFYFVLSNYGAEEFSTKQLERDFANCAYATIRTFVLKLSDAGILEEHIYGNRKKYCLTVT